jgi:hypothetical protein
MKMVHSEYFVLMGWFQTSVKKYYTYTQARQNTVLEVLSQNDATWNGVSGLLS